MSGTSEDHQRRAAEARRDRPVACAVLTVSDTRTPATDQSGPLIERLLADAGHATADRALEPDDPDRIAARLEAWIADPGIHAVLVTGGTGIAARDTTIEVVRRLLTTELEGFGELFRMLSYRRVRAAAMLSRAVAGLVARPDTGDTFVFAMPGSTDAVELALTELIAPQLAHLVWLRT